MKVFIYFNLHRKCWSIKALEGDQKGRVIRHAMSFVVTNCKLKVSEAGRQRVLREKRKNVHAGIVGTLFWADHGAKAAEGWGSQMLSYNPYKGATFFDVSTGEPVVEADTVVGCGRTVYYE